MGYTPAVAGYRRLGPAYRRRKPRVAGGRRFANSKLTDGFRPIVRKKSDALFVRRAVLPLLPVFGGLGTLSSGKTDPPSAAESHRPGRQP